MKILYLSAGHGQDYLRDCVAHGFRSLLGPDFVDVGRLDSLYVGADRSAMYGKGFTLYGELPDIAIDRDDIPRKIRDRYFDLVVYGSIHRCHDYLHEVASQYDPRRVIFIDGEDHPSYLKGLGGIYLKRELHAPQPGVFPIQFAIPKDKILSEPSTKIRLMAPMDPRYSSTYIYKDETSYYAQYAESFYAHTMKKAGWDCLRHYEILSQWCIPNFHCFDVCPPTIMEQLPRAAILLVRQCIDSGCLDGRAMEYIWDRIIQEVMAIVTENLTTESLATRILDTVGVRKKEYSCT